MSKGVNSYLTVISIPYMRKYYEKLFSWLSIFMILRVLRTDILWDGKGNRVSATMGDGLFQWFLVNNLVFTGALPHNHQTFIGTFSYRDICSVADRHLWDGKNILPFQWHVKKKSVVLKGYVCIICILYHVNSYSKLIPGCLNNNLVTLRAQFRTFVKKLPILISLFLSDNQFSGDEILQTYGIPYINRN